jgi:alkanesulfonate monooxygenase SsuD/methylene tetrahydromethanopterin reductase-like flavin-dependent oxidoreductase (luciferase family)
VSPYFGVILPNYGPALDRQELVAATRVAEAEGFDSAWVTDHVAVPRDAPAASVYGSITESVVTMGFLLGLTAGIQIGISALIVPQREPVLTLKQVSSLAYLAGGRVVIAVAPGWLEPEFERLGASFTGRGKRLDAWIERASSDDTLRPRPARPLELWAAGSGMAAVRRAAQLGVWHPVALRPEQIAPLAAALRRLRPDARVILRLGIELAEEPDPGGTDERGRHAVAGPPAYIAEQLARYRQAGCDGFLISLDTARPGLPQRIQRFAREVMKPAG